MVVAGLLVAAFFVDAFAGKVLSQADILFAWSPWADSAPAGAVASNGQRPGNPMLGDVPTFVYPSLRFTRDSLRALRFPIWNPDMYAGQPFLASYQTGLLSPFVLLSVVLPPPDALLAHAIVRLLIGGIGMFLFLRGLRLAAPAVWFGALTFLFNPFAIVWLEHPPSAVSCWLPWLLWSVDRHRQDGGLRPVAELAALTALTLLAGHPETAFKVLLLTGAYAVGVCLAGTDVRRLRADLQVLVGRLLPAVVLGAAMAAAQIVPFLEYMDESGIAAMRRTFAVSPMVVTPPTAVAAFVPDVFGNPSRGPFLTNYLEQTAYPGNVAWILAAVAVGVLARRRWRVGFFAGIALLAAALMYGAPGISRLFALIPMAGLSAPSRFGLVVIVAVVVLGAFGVDAVCERDRRLGDDARAMRAAGLALAIIAVIVAALIWWQWAAFHNAGLARHVAKVALWSGGVAAAALAVLIARARDVASTRIAVACLVAVSVADLFAVGFRFHPMMPRTQVYPRLPAIDLMAADRSLFRIAGVGDSLLPNAAMGYGLSDPRGYDGVAPRHYTDLLGRAFGPALGHRIHAHGVLPVADLLNIKYLVAPGGDRTTVPHWTPIVTTPATVYRNERVFPRAWLVDRAVVRDDASTLDWLVAPTSDLRHEAPIAEALGTAGPEPADGAAIGAATITRYEPTDVELTTNATGRRLLVLADAWYPGWHVYVDGRKASIVRAYYALRGVAVPAGRHHVRFAYEPASLRIGLLVSAAAVVAWIGLVLVAARRRATSRRAAAASPA